MKQVAKLIIIDHEDNYLLLYRANHPVFGDDPDLPGGTVEAGEQPLQTMLREVEEEAGVRIDDQQHIEELSSEIEQDGTHNTLFLVHIMRPEILLSWEHQSYAWLGLEEFLTEVSSANDQYMRLVHRALTTLQTD